MVNNCYSKVSNCSEYRITWTQGSIIILKIDKIWTQEIKTLKNTLLSFYKRKDIFQTNMEFSCASEWLCKKVPKNWILLLFGKLAHLKFGILGFTTAPKNLHYNMFTSKFKCTWQLDMKGFIIFYFPLNEIKLCLCLSVTDSQWLP